MQDIQSVGKEMGILFGGGVSGKLRLKPHNHQGYVHGHQTSLKCRCPRCDSLDTKFCYYNNYNLSQPRFFCKGCRRYWTKGGVLRNVPVGGGCRKTKRSKKKPGSRSPSTVDVATTSEQKPSNSQNSNSNSSPATTTTKTTPFSLTEAVPTYFSFQESRFDPPVLDQCSTDMFSETATFKSLLTSSSDLVFNPVSEITSFMQKHDEDEMVEKKDLDRQHWVQEATAGGGVVAEEWDLFDQSYWWNDNQNHQLNYFPA